MSVTPIAGGQVLNSALIPLLRCPRTFQPLVQVGQQLVTTDRSQAYAITHSGIPLFGGAGLSDEARIQETHYDRIAEVYSHNLEQEHTREYFHYLDQALLRVVGDGPLDTVAEICCGAGEAFQLLRGRVGLGIGVDVSTAMLERARVIEPDSRRLFVQGDAVRLPLADAAFDAVFMLGGIHHVNDRAKLFGEVHRILRPGGRFIWREPVDDFFAWRFARTIIYRLSSTLQEDTERPLRYRETVDQLKAAGMPCTVWRTLGFAGYCVLMNSDVLAVNRVWAYLPGAASLTRLAARFDDIAVRLPGLRRAGALVVGAAVRT